MFNTPNIILATVNKFISDEIHITGKYSKNPKALLSFVPIDDKGERIEIAPVAIVSLEGDAFNEWFANWNTEKDLYSLLIDILKNNIKGITISGVDLTKLGSLDNLKVDEIAEEVLAPVPEEVLASSSEK